MCALVRPLNVRISFTLLLLLLLGAMSFSQGVDVKQPLFRDFSKEALLSYVSDPAHGTQLFVLQRDYKIEARWSSGDFAESDPLLSWSMAKSYLNYLLSFAVRKEFLSLDKSICSYIPNLSKESPVCKVKLLDLFSMSSGIAWKESYENDVAESDVLRMLYGTGRKDVARYILSLELEAEPGKMYRYSSGDSNLLAYVLKLSVERHQKWQDFLNDANGLFSIKAPVFFEADSQSNPILSSYLYMTEMSYLNFGDMFLRPGYRVGQDWLDLSLSVPESFGLEEARKMPTATPGRQWWTNKMSPNGHRPWPNLPEDSFAAMGHWGNFLLIIPSQKTLILRIATDKTSAFDINKMASFIALPKSSGVAFKEEKTSPSFKLSFIKNIEFVFSFTAKMFCSCRFVQNKSAEYCSKFVDTKKIPLWLLAISEDGSKKEVSSGFWPLKRVSKFKENLGCIFE